MVRRGEIWWADLAIPRASEPGYLHPVLVIQSDPFNQSAIQTVLVALLTSNLRRSKARGNVLIPATELGLAKDSVVNVTQIATLDKAYLVERCGNLDENLLKKVDEGLRLVMGLS